MKVKVGDVIHDSDEEPLMVILSLADKENINNMFPDCTKYAAYPNWFKSLSNKWMETEPATETQEEIKQ